MFFQMINGAIENSLYAEPLSFLMSNVNLTTVDIQGKWALKKSYNFCIVDLFATKCDLQEISHN